MTAAYAGKNFAGEWTRIVARFSVEKGDTPVTIAFAGAGTNDTIGGLLDSIDLQRVSAVPVPAALPLLATAIAGLGFMGRRKRSA